MADWADMLKVMTIEKALALLSSEIERSGKSPQAEGRRVSSEQVLLSDASGRILSAPIVAPMDVPAFDRSQVDGLAVRAIDTFGASEPVPAILHWAGEIAMGQPATQALQAGECMGIATGGMLPPGADAVVMIEDVEQIGADTRLVTRSVSPGSHVTLRGDDTRAGQAILPAGRCLHASEIGALAALGLGTADVLPQVKVGILSTGDELVPAGTIHDPGQAPQGTVFDSNGPMLIAAVHETLCQPVSFGIIRDQLDELTTTLKSALQQTDLVLISGGSSAGVRDYVEQAITAAGQPGVILHGLAVKPGKPTLAGLCDGKLVIGLPGHPVAAWFIFEQLVKPLLAALSGRVPVERPKVSARTTCRIPSNHGREEFILVRLSKASAKQDPGGETRWLAEPLPTRSGLVTLLSASDGYLVIDRDKEGLEAGSTVDVTLLHN